MKTIFVADDDPLMREMITRTLHKKGLSVKVFASADALLERFQFEYPNLIVSDIQMPGTSGLELLEILRCQGSDVPVMLMSGHITPEIEARAKALTVARLIHKPIKDIAGLVAAIRVTVGDAPRGRGDHALDEMRSNFLINLAHDLRTPLTAVKLALDSLFARRVDAMPPEERKMAEIGRRNVDRIIETVEHQLDLLRAELGELPLADEPEAQSEKDSEESQEDLETVR